jgi:hypothetical protein
LLDNGEVKDPETVANASNNFFLPITETLNLHQMEKEDAISFLKASFSLKCPALKSFQPLKVSKWLSH